MTGASSGVGREMARALAARGHQLALVARRLDRLERLGRELRLAYGVSVDLQARDLAVREERDALWGWLSEDERALQGLCNCAGIGAFGRFDELPLDRERAQVGLHAEALVDLVHGALPGMLERRSGGILNIGSIAAVQPIPHNATYAATKAFVASFSEALHAELRGTGVSCTLVSPGPIRTEFAASAGVGHLRGAGPRLLWSEPAEIASAALGAMEEGRRSIVPRSLPRVAAACGRFSPRPLVLRLLSSGGARLLGLGERHGSSRPRTAGPEAIT